MSEQTVLVEATSLSAVTDIASDPPESWDATIDIPAAPLVLYIARVPGRRDVFLTPLKPRQKVVTAEDVQSSLYYVHIHGEDDSALETSPDRSTSRDSMFSDDTQNVSDTVPALPVRPHRSAPPLPARPMRHLNPSDLIGAPKVTEASELCTLQAQNIHMIKRKPVKPISQDEGMPHNRSMESPRLPPRPLPTLPHDENMRPGIVQQRHNHFKRSDTTEQDTHSERANRSIDGLITLIRRDPASSEQWNVANIGEADHSAVGVDDFAASRLSRRIRQAGAPLDLCMTSPGYEKFNRDQVERLHPSIGQGHGLWTGNRFTRVLGMSTSVSDGIRTAGEYAANDVASIESGGSSRLHKFKRHSAHISAALSKDPSASNKHSKNYTFKSPWNTLCEFTTPALGSALKCHHYAPGMFQGFAQFELSELRFNLPSKAQHRPPVASGNQHSYVQSEHRRHDSFDSWDADGSASVSAFDGDGKFGLSLGREKAGGGTGGKQAKLGKLIIYPEGVKMLDLLVAANMALWWRAYEKL